MDLVVNNTDVVLIDDVTIEVDSESTIKSSGQTDLAITFDNNEYSIVGDDMVVVTKYDDAPMWLKNTIDNIVSIKTAVAVGDLEAVKESLDVMLGELEVAKNTYELSIISSADIDSRINTAITTLNSSLQEADATILEIAQTATTPAEASAIAINTLSASLSANGAIGSAIHNLESAMATLEGTTAESISYLESTMEGEINGNASAMQTIRTYVGIDEVGASTGTGLSGYLEGSDGTIGGADSQLVNDIKVNAEVVESKWAYNSTLMLAGKYYKSGFGLESSVHISGSGTQADPYTSEFWIDASKFKFTNSAKTGSKAPFTIDASGSTPQVQFNGIVSFSNVTGYTPPDVSGSIATNNDVFAQKLGYANYAAMVNAANSGQTVINGGYINTGLIQAGAITANKINTSGLVAEDISTTTLNGKVINGARINGSVIKASYLDLDGDLEVLTNYHLCTSTAQLNAIIAAGGTGRLVLDADKLVNGGDAVYITADNEWRIPSISTAREVTKSTLVSTSGALVNGTLYSYNTTNTGTNNKAVKRSPVFTNTNSFTLINAYATSIHTGVVNYINSNHFRIKLGNTVLLECRMWWESNAGQWDGNLQLVRVQYSGAFFSTITHTHNAYYTGGPGATSVTDTVNIGIGSLQLTWSYNTASYTTPTTVVGVLLPGTVQYPANWDEGCLQLESVTMYQGYDPFKNPTNDTSKVTFSTSTGLYINNMI